MWIPPGRIPADFRGAATGGPESLPSPRRGPVDAGKDHGEADRVDLDAVASVGFGPLERAGLEPLVPDRQAVMIEIEDLDAIPAPVDEEEEVAVEEVLPETFLDEAGEPVEALAHVDGPG